jgi:superfamily II DNA/RNA helicase
MRSLILIPTRELGLQLLSVISNICEIRKTTRSYLLSGGFNEKIQTSELCTPLDILISTPERLLYHYSLKHIHFDDLKHLVIDEADTVCSDPFKSDLSALIKHIRVNISSIEN